MTYEAPLFVPTFESLARCEFDVLMQAVINKYNDSTVEFNAACDSYDELNAKFTTITQELDSYKRLCDSHRLELDELKLVNSNQELTLKSYEDTLLTAEKVAHAKMALERENVGLKQQVKQFQQTLSAANPQKMKAQNQRLKEKNVELTKKTERLQLDISQMNKVIKEKDSKLVLAANAIRDQQKEIIKESASGIYHKDNHHLIVWPQPTTMERADGSLFKGRSLMYLHQSGRGGLVTFDPENNQTSLCAAPKGGFRNLTDTMEWAHNWLFKVNVLQEGEIKDEDMKPVNYNPDNIVEI